MLAAARAAALAGPPGQAWVEGLPPQAKAASASCCMRYSDDNTAIKVSDLLVLQKVYQFWSEKVYQFWGKVYQFLTSNFVGISVISTCSKSTKIIDF